MKGETDYSENDIGQLVTRIQVFLEMVWAEKTWLKNENNGWQSVGLANCT